MTAKLAKVFFTDDVPAREGDHVGGLNVLFETNRAVVGLCVQTQGGRLGVGSGAFRSGFAGLRDRRFVVARARFFGRLGLVRG